MGAGVADDFLAMIGVELNRNGVAHRAGRHENGGLFAEYRRCPLFEMVDRRIFAVHIVADLGLSHGLAHSGGRLGYGVTSEIDDQDINSANTSLESITP